MKSKIIITLWCLILFSILTHQAFANQELDIEAIVAGLKKYDELIESGEADIIYKWSQYNMQDRQTHSTYSERHIVFSGDKTFLDIKKNIMKIEEIEGDIRNFNDDRRTFLVKKNGVLSASYNVRHGNYYMFRSIPQHPEVMESDPRHLTRGMFGGPLSDYIVKKNFVIKSKEVYDDVLCYVLESRDGQKVEQFWISPDRGFGYLKRKTRQPADGIPPPPRCPEKGTPEVLRRRISYQQNGGAWFPEKTSAEVLWIDEEGKEHLIRKEELEVKNLCLNHKISDETFNAEITDGSKIWIEDLSKYASMEEYLKLYGSGFSDE